MKAIVVTEKESDIGSNNYASAVVLLQSFYSMKKLTLCTAGVSYENFLIGSCYTLLKFEFRTLALSRFKNQSIGSLKLLGHNCHHQGKFVTQKVVAFHCFGLKFPDNFIVIAISGKNYECYCHY